MNLITSFLLIFFTHTAMIDSSIVYLKYDQFLSIVNVDKRFNEEKLKIEKLFIENQNMKIVHSTWYSGENLPEGGLYFDHIEKISKLLNLKELRLIDLFFNILPESMVKLEKLETLDLCLSRDADVEQSLKVLKKLKSLKHLDLNGSRISEKQRAYIRNELQKKGVEVNDIVMLKSD